MERAASLHGTRGFDTRNTHAKQSHRPSRLVYIHDGVGAPSHRKNRLYGVALLFSAVVIADTLIWQISAAHWAGASQSAPSGEQCLNALASAIVGFRFCLRLLADACQTPLSVIAAGI